MPSHFCSHLFHTRANFRAPRNTKLNGATSLGEEDQGWEILDLHQETRVQPIDYLLVALTANSTYLVRDTYTQYLVCPVSSDPRAHVFTTCVAERRCRTTRDALFTFKDFARREKRVGGRMICLTTVLISLSANALPSVSRACYRAWIYERPEQRAFYSIFLCTPFIYLLLCEYCIIVHCTYSYPLNTICHLRNYNFSFKQSDHIEELNVNE